MKLAGKYGCKHLRGKTELGPFWLSRNTEEEVKKLDGTTGLERLNQNNYMWYLIPQQYQSVTELVDTKKGLTAMIVGKGPGLDSLSTDVVDGVDIILATNDSVHHVVNIVGDSGVPVYNVQCDPLAGSCQNDGAIPIVLSNCALFYGKAEELYVAKVTDFPDDNWHPVGCTAIHIAKLMGCEHLVFIGFDGSFDKKMGYASVISKSPTEGRYTNPNRFASHGEPMKEVIGDLGYTIHSVDGASNTPKREEMAHDTSASCTPEQLQDSQQEPREPDHEEPQVQTQDNEDSLY